MRLRLHYLHFPILAYHTRCLGDSQKKKKYKVLGRLYPRMAKNTNSWSSMNPLYKGDKEESIVFNINHQRMVPFRANWQCSNSYPSTSLDFRDANTIYLEGKHRNALTFRYSSYWTRKDPKCLCKQVVHLSTKKIGRKVCFL